MPSAPLVLLADDCAEALDVIGSQFSEAGFEVARAGDGAEAWASFQRRVPDLVVSDVRMPEGDGFDLLRRIREVSDLPVILLTAYGEISLAVAAIRSGADDYLRFPDDLDRLVSRARELLSRSKEDPGDVSSQLISGVSKAARELRSRVRALGALAVPILVCGEPGTGRARVARALHAASQHAELPLVPWADLGGAPPKEPCVVFIEEIERLERDEQGRGLQEIRRIAQHRADGVARVLASASPLLHDAVASRAFHPELWHVLSRFQLQVLPLRERPEDVEPLAHDLLGEAARRLGRQPLALSPAALAELGKREWPGNVRELRDVIEQAVAFEKGARLGVGAIRDAIEQVIAKRGDSLETQRAARRSAQRKELVDLLAACGGNVAEMARRLSLTRGAVIYRLQKHGLMT
jgi:DNA-binding NtrC family response regulator